MKKLTTALKRNSKKVNTKVETKVEERNEEDTMVKRTEITLPELRLAIIEAAKKAGGEIRETSAYTGIRINGRNAAELHISKKQVTLIIAHDCLTKDLKAVCHQVPPTFKWVLDSKYIVTTADKLPNAEKMVQLALKHTLQINNINAKANEKALKAQA